MSVKLTAAVEKEKLFATTKVLKKKGYMEITGVTKQKDDEEGELTEDGKKRVLKFIESLKKGDTIPVDSFEIKEGKTSPPKRYTEGIMMLAMENAGNLIEDEELRQQIKKTGIGTSATRGGILKKLVDIGYLNENKKSLILTPSKLGEMIFEVVDMSVPTLLNPEMTANWEKGLEGIINGTVDAVEYRSKLEDYIRRETLKIAGSNMQKDLYGRFDSFTRKKEEPEYVDGINCPMCGGRILKMHDGMYKCENYSKDKEGACRFNVYTVLSHKISEKELKDLVNNGVTGMIKGFVSKGGKRFDAKLRLNKDESGKITGIGFDFG